MSISYGEIHVIQNMTDKELKQAHEDYQDTVSAIESELERRENTCKIEDCNNDSLTEDEDGKEYCDDHHGNKNTCGHEHVHRVCNDCDLPLDN